MWRLLVSVQAIGGERVQLSLPASEIYLLDINCPTAKPTWTRAGYGRLVMSMDGVEFPGASVTVGIKDGGLLPGANFEGFKLRFDPVPWLPPSTLFVYSLAYPAPQPVYVPSPMPEP